MYIWEGEEVLGGGGGIVYIWEGEEVLGGGGGIVYIWEGEEVLCTYGRGRRYCVQTPHHKCILLRGVVLCPWP